jgi:hypothetical protein
LLQGIQWDSQEAGVPLCDGLKSACRARLKQTSTGDVLIGTLSNGKSAQFAIPEPGRGCSPQEIAEEISRLYDLHAVAKAALIAGGTADPSDELIAAEMKFRLQPVRSFRQDHSRSRIGHSLRETEVALV